MWNWRLLNLRRRPCVRAGVVDSHGPVFRFMQPTCAPGKSRIARSFYQKFRISGVPAIRAITFASLLGLFLSGASFAQESDEALDVEYATPQPLATESLLLNLVETPAGRLVAVGERGHVVLSDDQGETWRQAQVVPTRSTLTSLTAFENRLWAAGHDSVIITSGDGGETWTRQYFDPERQQPVMHIRFFDAHSGVAMGAYGLYLVTEDGGQTWQDEMVDPDNEYHLNDMVVLDGGRRMIAGEAGFSYRSLDGGATWEAMELPYQGSMWGAQLVADGCVLFYGLRGHILETCDFGDSWQELSAKTQASLSGSAFHDGQTVLVGNSGTIVVRDSSGAFTVGSYPGGVDLAAALSLGDGRFILTGEEGIHAYPRVEGDGAQGAAGNE